MDTRIKKLITIMINKESQKNKNKIIWVFTGGVSINLFLNFPIKNYKKINKITFDRFNMDIDIYSLNKNYFCLNEKIHNLFKIQNDSNIKKINLKCEKKYEKTTYYIDSLYNYHFDYILPTEKNIVEINFENKKIFSLSPEFLVAFKLFGYKGFRKKDYIDSIKVLNSIVINENKFWNIIKKTNYFPIINKIANKTNIIFQIKTGEIYNKIYFELIKKYQNLSKHIDIRKIPYELLVTLLYLKKFKISKKQDKIINEVFDEKHLNFIQNENIAKFIILFLIHKLENPNKQYIISIIKNTYESNLQHNKQKFKFELFWKAIFYFGRYLNHLNQNFKKNNNKTKQKIKKILNTEFLTLSLIKKLNK